MNHSQPIKIWTKCKIFPIKKRGNKVFVVLLVTKNSATRDGLKLLPAKSITQSSLSGCRPLWYLAKKALICLDNTTVSTQLNRVIPIELNTQLSKIIYYLDDSFLTYVYFFCHLNLGLINIPLPTNVLNASQRCGIVIQN